MKSKETSLVGRPRAVSTRSIVISAALGILAAPMLANVAVKLKERNLRRRQICNCKLFDLPDASFYYSEEKITFTLTNLTVITSPIPSEIPFI